MFYKSCAMIRESDKLLVISSIIIGIVAFLYIHGTRVLDFQYDAWLLTGGDLTQHYLGWTFFRNSAWHFPIGLMDGIIYPELVSIVYTDSIPLFAIIFKLFDHVLPANFQYFGFWGLWCYALQSLLSAFIIKYFIRNNLVCLLGSVFFTLSATLMWRLYAHTALAGQWLILLAMLLFLYRNKLTCRSKNVLWGGIAILCVSVHAYFVPMVFAFLLAGCIMDYLEHRNVRQLFFNIVAYGMAVLLTLYLLGALANGKVPYAGGLGIFSCNLNTFFSPRGTSIFLPDLPDPPLMFQFEGFAYLGAGMLLLVSMSIVILLLRRNKLRHFYEIHRADIIGMGLVSFVFVVLASLPIMTFGGEVLFTIEYPRFLHKALSVFRANGRFIWVAMYCVMLGSVILCSKTFKIKFAVILLTVAVIIQIADFSSVISARHDKYSAAIAPLTLSEDVSDLMGNGVNHITFLPDTENDANLKLYKVAMYAQQNKLSISDFYLARKSKDELHNRIKDKMRQIEDNVVLPDEVFVINDEIFFLGDKTALNCYMIEGIIFASFKEQERLAQYRYNGSDKINILDMGMHVSNGNENNKQFTIFPGGIVFGPYATMRRGVYIVEITGSNLAEMEYDVSYDSGKNVLPLDGLVQTNQKVTYKISANDLLPDVEFRIRNNSKVNGEVKTIFMKRAD